MAELVVSVHAAPRRVLDVGWADQRVGLGECARVLAPGGHLVLADLFSPPLVPTLLAGRRGKARTRRRASQLLSAGHDLYAVIINAVTATIT